MNLPSGEGDASGSSDSGELSEAGESDQVKITTSVDVDSLGQIFFFFIHEVYR